MNTSLTFESLSTEWSRTDSEGLVRVIPSNGFRASFGIVARISQISDDDEYYPELVMTHDTVVVKIDDHDEPRALMLASRIDELLDETHA